MALSSLISGTVTLSDGSKHEWRAGPGERIKAERTLGIRLTNIQENISEEYIAFLAYSDLSKRSVPGLASTFDGFIEQLDDYEVITDPESPTPPAQ
ncbi:MAG: hypothetical protein KGL39_23035 [Patescibacteria group bacterium]|nr:hypothetical protein [Patescibacteria group bacterium]